MAEALKRKGGGEKLMEKKKVRGDGLGGRGPWFGVGRVDGNCRAIFFPQPVAGDPGGGRGGYKGRGGRKEGGGGKYLRPITQI